MHYTEIPLAGFLFLVFFFLPLFLTDIKEVCSHTHGRTKGRFKIKADVGVNVNQSQETRKHKEITEGAKYHDQGRRLGDERTFRDGKNIWCQQIFKFEHKQAS